MFNNKITKTILALACVCAMAVVVVAPVGVVANEGVQVACDAPFRDECF